MSCQHLLEANKKQTINSLFCLHASWFKKQGQVPFLPLNLSNTFRNINDGIKACISFLKSLITSKICPFELSKCSCLSQWDGFGVRRSYELQFFIRMFLLTILCQLPYIYTLLKVLFCFDFRPTAVHVMIVYMFLCLVTRVYIGHVYTS